MDVEEDNNNEEVVNEEEGNEEEGNEADNVEGESLVNEGERMDGGQTQVRSLSKKELAGNCVGVYTKDPLVYWVFSVDRCTTKAVFGRWLNCVNGAERLYEMLEDLTSIPYKHVIRKNRRLSDFVGFDLDAHGNLYQVPLAIHSAFHNELQKLG